MLFFYCTLFSLMHLKSCLRIRGILEIQKLEFFFFTTIIYTSYQNNLQHIFIYIEGGMEL